MTDELYAHSPMVHVCAQERANHRATHNKPGGFRILLYRINDERRAAMRRDSDQAVGERTLWA